MRKKHRNHQERPNIRFISRIGLIDKSLLDHVDGYFAFIILDQRRGSVWCTITDALQIRVSDYFGYNQRHLISESNMTAISNLLKTHFDDEANRKYSSPNFIRVGLCYRPWFGSEFS